MTRFCRDRCPLGAQPRGLQAALGWSPSKTKSVSQRARRKMAAFLEDRASGVICAERRALIDAFIVTSIPQWRGTRRVAWTTSSTQRCSFTSPGCEDCWATWHARRRSLRARCHSDLAAARRRARRRRACARRAPRRRRGRRAQRLTGDAGPRWAGQCRRGRGRQHHGDRHKDRRGLRERGVRRSGHRRRRARRGAAAAARAPDPDPRQQRPQARQGCGRATTHRPGRRRAAARRAHEAVTGALGRDARGQQPQRSGQADIDDPGAGHARGSAARERPARPIDVDSVEADALHARLDAVDAARAAGRRWPLRVRRRRRRRPRLLDRRAVVCREALDAESQRSINDGGDDDATPLQREARHARCSRQPRC